MLFHNIYKADAIYLLEQVGVNLVEVNFPVKIKIVLSLLRREKNLNRDQCDLLLSFGQMSSAQAIANSSVMFQSS